MISCRRNLHLCYRGLGFSAALLTVGVQGGGRVPGITEHYSSVTHKDSPSAIARCYLPVSTDPQAPGVGSTTPLPRGVS